MQDLKQGMKLPGIVTNITAFGAFVDIGVHQDGLVHISQLANRFVRDPNEVVKVHQEVLVTVLDVDIPRPRDFRVLSSPTYTRLKEECISAVHEEALKAFKAGEREM